MAKNNHNPATFKYPKDFLRQKLDSFYIIILDIRMFEEAGVALLRVLQKQGSLPAIMLIDR
ncbi:MAG: hypothetical protein KAS61_00415 [Spirochaetes bacterium]|nr:hypothetical protein [Spirochaetota bacterium]